MKTQWGRDDVAFEGYWLVLTAVAAGTISVLLAIAAIRFWDRLAAGSGRRSGRDHLEGALKPTILLFRGGALVDATAPARTLLDRVNGPDDDWTRLRQWAGPRFPDGIARLDRLDELGRVEMLGGNGAGSAALRLTAERIEDAMVRVTIVDPQAEHAGIVVDSMSQQAMEEELDLLRKSLDQTPMLVWRQDACDAITWANAAYLRRAEAHAGGMLSWPLPRLLDPPKPAPGGGPSTRRASLESDGIMSWYDCHSHQIGDQTMMFALPADAAVRAERSLREFVQTLTKTFADLPIGLAIFDRQRHLQLFNPALIDLTGLPTGFLTARPTLFDLLDQLRESRMVPEPKDFRSWRQHMNNLESAAATGHHVETWSLPGGQTYRVTGRPHPDGAVAFLFEDITSEISLTRKFRADLSLGENVIDGLDDGLAAFSSSGQILMTNQSYRRIWGGSATTLAEALSDWEGRVENGPGFAALRARLTAGSETSRDTGLITGPDGALLDWRVTRIGGARQLLRFRRAEIAATTPGQDGAAPLLTRAVGAD
ncbi:MAG: PAS-domain containing protein [Paracoccus sp. (in: a-proteobacteria)]|uniref:PAS-domain containing protein n=2 Tax=Paracoccus TaxID=265 RepID=UPI0025D11C65|nr:PAS-domain containing protein [Paracoccus sp. UBA889]